jgi:PKD repeat protein
LPVSVSFTDESFNSPTSCLWDFGDGGTSALKNPRHTYRTANTYTVTLDVWKASASASCTVPNVMKILPCGYSPVRVGQSYWQTPQLAYTNAGGGVIEMQALEFAGDLMIDGPDPVTLRGGFNCDYSATLPETVIKGGRLTISGGAVTVDGLTVQ